MTAPALAAEDGQTGTEPQSADSTPTQQPAARPPLPSSNTPTARKRRTLKNNRW